MARYTGPVCRLCRREGTKLYLKGERCYSPKCSQERRAFAPGQHGQKKKKQSPYSVQLREKQKLKRIYGLLEKQCRMYYSMAEKMRGVTGENMLSLIERRLDNVVYRMGIGDSRALSRQIVCHGHITVNGKRVDIPSYIVNKDDEIAVKANKTEKTYFVELKESTYKPQVNWIEFDAKELKGKVLALPVREDIDASIAEHMIVELYSK